MTRNSLANLSRLPEVVDQSIAVPISRRPRLLTSVCGPLRYVFSGTTWYLAQAAITEAVIDGAFALTMDTKFSMRDTKSNMRLQTRGALWKLQRFLEGRKTGGYKFEPAFSNALWSQYFPLLADTVIINNTQVFGDFFIKNYNKLNVTPCFYIDGTLTEYFYGYAAVEESIIDPDVMARSIEMEREGYLHAARILTMSRATERNLIEVYGVSPSRVTRVMPGANIDDAAVLAPSLHKGWVGHDFTLGFVGLYPLRKGLDKLAEAVCILRSRGAPIRLRVIGRCPDAIAAMDGVDFLGTISKVTDIARFVEAIRTVDLGCQISRAELLGIAMLEFMRVGVPIMATDVGGMPDVLEGGGGILVAADITADQLAEELHTLMIDSTRYEALRQAAIHRSEWASWRRAAWEMDAALVGVS
jgi:glycosyltransferase involved in cell wall biosynthesis